MFLKENSYDGLACFKMILEIISVIVIIVVIIITGIQWTIYTKLKMLKHFNGPDVVPLFGNMFSIPLDPIGSFKKIEEWVEIYKNNIRVFVGPQVKILVTDPDIAEVVLGSTQPVDKSDDYNFLKTWLGEGLLLSSGSKWKARRKILTPAFHFKILEQYIHVFNSSNEIFVEKLLKHANGEEFDVYPYITLNAMDIICETTMGISINAQQNAESEYVSTVKEMCAVVYRRLFKVSGRIEFLFKLTADGRSERNLLKILHKTTDDVIIARRKIRTERSKTENEINEFGVKRKLSFLDVLLESTINGQPLSNKDIREEVDTFMFEGHDTVSSAIGFAFYCLANNPVCQKKAFLELYDIFGNDKTKDVTYSDLQNMKYLELIIKEVLRLYPSVPIIGRQFKKDTEIKGLMYPKNTSIGLIIYIMHRDNNYFPNAEQFIPERFIEERTEKNPYVYIPFSAGGRNCIGQKFAMLEMKAILSKVLRYFEILPGTTDIQLEAALILKSVNGIHVKLKHREYP